MGLSSNTLWHQTKKDGLKGIIKNQCLYLSYSLETATSNLYNGEFVFPMVSVCDLPLAETGNYLKKYGDYIIGFSAEWGRRNHFSSVWYCDQNSFTLKTMVEMLANRIKAIGDEVESDMDYQKIVYILSYIKLYEGPLPKRHFKNYRFYDERELRYVPDAKTLSDYNQKQMLLNYEEYKKAHNNSSLLPKSLNIPFDWKDVKYIIVEREKEKIEFRNYIEKCSGMKDLNISYLTNSEVKEDIIGMCHDVPSPIQFEPVRVDIDKIVGGVLEKFKKKLLEEYKEKALDNKP